MIAISLWQPWASAIVLGLKSIETRHWPVKYRGPIAIHAAKRLESHCGEELDELLLEHAGVNWRKELPRGAVIAVANLVGCEPTERITPHRIERICGNFGPGRFGWIFTDVRALKEPVPYIGRQRLFQIPAELLAA